MRAQVAIEFIIIFGMFLAATIIISIAVRNNIADEERTYIEFEASRIIDLAAGRINTAYIEGNGFSINLVMPEKLGLYDYTLQFDGNMIWLHALNVSYSRKLLTPNITGTLASGENKISNVNGIIVIS